MTDSAADATHTPESSVSEQRDHHVRRYATRVMVGVIVLCNTVFLAGIWGSGVDLERLIRVPDEFNPEKDVCLRLAWHQVAGLDKPIRLCAEWINLSDPSGHTHEFQRDTVVVQSADGKLYFDHAPRVDYRLLVIVVFLLVVIVFGIVLNRYVISRYRERLQAASAATSSIVP